MRAAARCRPRSRWWRARPGSGSTTRRSRRWPADDVVKCGVRDLAPVAPAGGYGATTVAATAHLAARAGIRLFATGGLGGVHRGARETWDESADLETLARRIVAWSARASSRSSTWAPRSSASRR